jgi:starch synthase (maltosyl-transferring)
MARVSCNGSARNPKRTPCLVFTNSATRSTSELILNGTRAEPWHHQEFYTDSFRHFIQAGGSLRDVSPEYPLDYIPEPFHYALRPGQGIVLVASRN